MMPKYDANWFQHYNKSMTNNPYVNNLIEMGYDKQDVQVASEMFKKHEFPKYIHGRYFESEEQYREELHDFLNGM
jgi:hypothetical protein